MQDGSSATSPRWDTYVNSSGQYYLYQAYNASGGAGVGQDLTLNNNGSLSIATTSSRSTLTVSGGANIDGDLNLTRYNDGLSTASIVVDNVVDTAIALAKVGGGNINNIGLYGNTISAGGNVIPSANNTDNLGASGSDCGCLYYNNSTLGTCASDERLKTNIEPLDFDYATSIFGTATTTALGQVEELQPRTFNFLSAPTSMPYEGLIAQEVLPVAPEIVATSSNGYYELD